MKTILALAVIGLAACGGSESTTAEQPIFPAYPPNGHLGDDCRQWANLACNPGIALECFEGTLSCALRVSPCRPGEVFCISLPCPTGTHFLSWHDSAGREDSSWCVKN